MTDTHLLYIILAYNTAILGKLSNSKVTQALCLIAVGFVFYKIVTI